MLFLILVQLFIRNLFSELDNHFSSDQFEYLIYPKGPFSALHSLLHNDFVDQFSVFHHFDTCGDSVRCQNTWDDAEPCEAKNNQGHYKDHNMDN